MAVVVSAPGKVLIIGGYLVLEQPNIGLVLSTSARFYAIVKPLHESLAPDSWSWAWSDVKVSSPQLFKETNYKLCLRDYSVRNVAPSEGDNPFVENAVSMAVAVAAAKTSSAGSMNKLLLQGLEITILGANSFYSFRKQIEAQQLPLTVETLTSLPEFSPITRNPTEVASGDSNVLPEVAKTGLGSSAAMTAAVVASVLQYLNAVKLPVHGHGKDDDSDLRQTLDLVHAVSQAAHCAAQGKVGSGFDISAAVYGSQRYVRFSPAILSAQEGSSRRQTYVEKMKKLMQEDWDGERSPYGLPPGLTLILGEPGYGGSHTPSLVGAVMKWRKQGTEQVNRVWSGLAKANLRVEVGLKRLNSLAESVAGAYSSVLELCSTLSVEQWQGIGANKEGADVLEALLETRNAFELVRSLMREMGEAAGVPLEPPIQTELLDSTIKMNGVLFAGVPGAGGFDAVFAITLGKDARNRVEQDWSGKGVLSLPVTEDPQGVSLEQEDPRTKKVGSALHALSI